MANLKDINEELEKAKNLKDDKKHEEAINILEELYEENPNEERIKKRLIEARLDYAGYLNDEFVMEYKKALDTLKKVLDIDPKNYRALYNIGITYHNLGQNENAIDALQSALEIKPDYKYCYYNLGLIYESMSEFFKALRAYNKALKLDKDFGYAAQAKRDMQQIIDSSEKIEIPMIEKIDEQSRNRLIKLLRMSKRIDIEILEEILEIKKSEIMELIINWGDKYQFKLDGNYLIINEDTLPLLLEDLE